MRIVGTLPHPRFRIVVYELDKHLYVEFEAGPMKQGYKWPKAKMKSLGTVQAAMDEDFLLAVEERFNAMYADMKRLLDAQDQ